MKRWVWITASLAALFGLQGALCAVACLESPAFERVSELPVAEMPCHGGPADSTPEPADPAPEHACSCGASDVALTEDGGALAASLVAGLQPARPFVWQLARGVTTRLHAQAPERLPPPDTLLLKSTLIL